MVRDVNPPFHISKCKNITNIHQASLNKVFVMQSYLLLHFLGKKTNKEFVKTKRLGVKLKL